MKAAATAFPTSVITRVDDAFPWIDGHRPASAATRQRLWCHHGEEVLKVEGCLYERVPGETGASNHGVNVRFAAEVNHLEAPVGQLLDVGQRGPDQVLDAGLPCGRLDWRLAGVEPAPRGFEGRMRPA